MWGIKQNILQRTYSVLWKSMMSEYLKLVEYELSVILLQAWVWIGYGNLIAPVCTLMFEWIWSSLLYRSWGLKLFIGNVSSATSYLDIHLFVQHNFQWSVWSIKDWYSRTSWFSMLSSNGYYVKPIDHHHLFLEVFIGIEALLKVCHDDTVIHSITSPMQVSIHIDAVMGRRLVYIPANICLMVFQCTANNWASQHQANHPAIFTIGIWLINLVTTEMVKSLHTSIMVAHDKSKL